MLRVITLIHIFFAVDFEVIHITKKKTFLTNDINFYGSTNAGKPDFLLKWH